LAVAAGIGSAQFVEDSVDVGGAWVGSLAYNSRADVVYGISNSGDFLFAISCSTNRVVSWVSAYYPRSVCYDSLDNKAFCTFGLGAESLLVVDGMTHARLRALPLPDAALMEWDAADDRLYVSRDEADSVAVIDCRNDSVVAHIAVGAGPLRMHLNAQHRKLYVQNYDGCSISVVDLASNQVIRTIPLGAEPQSGVYSASAGKYYAGAGRHVVAISGARDSLLTTVALPQGVAVLTMTESEVNSRVLVATFGANESLYAIDVVADTISARVRAPAYALAWSPLTNLVYCAGDMLSIVTGDGVRVVTRLTVGWGPLSLVLAWPQHLLYVGHANTRMVYVVRDERGVSEGHAGVTGRSHPRPTVLAAATLETDGAGVLVDVSGREVLKLVAGENDLRRLAPGVYGALWSDGRRPTRVVKTR
jgi:YVTN family beta-propeller protein